MKKIKITYWITTVLITLIMLSSGIGYLVKLPQFEEAMKELGYPEYFIYILGVSKILGVIALLQKKYVIYKEWAYAGFAFVLIAATISHMALGQYDHAPVSLLWLIILFASYWSNSKILIHTKEKFAVS